MSRLRRWAVKALIGRNMVIANVSRQTNGILRPKYPMGSAAIWASTFLFQPGSSVPALKFPSGARNVKMDGCVFRADPIGYGATLAAGRFHANR